MWISSRSDKNKKEKEERQAPVVEIVMEYMEMTPAQYQSKSREVVCWSEWD